MDQYSREFIAEKARLRLDRFYRATRELGRVFKTEFILDYLSQPALRTRIRRGLLSRENSYTPSPGASTTADWADWISATSNANPARRAACFASSQLSSIGRFGEIDRVLSEAGSDGRTISTSSYCPISARSGGTTSSSTASTSSTAVSCEAKGLAYKFARFWALPCLGTKMLPKLRSGDDLTVSIDFSVSIRSRQCIGTGNANFCVKSVSRTAGKTGL